MADDQTDQQAAPTPDVLALGPALLQRGVIIPSFAQFAVTGEDNIRVITAGAVGGVTIHVQGRFLDAASGKTIPFDFPCRISSDRSEIATIFPLGTGYILNLSVYAVPPVVIGQCFVIVTIVRGLSGALFLVGTLLAGYVTNAQALGWPGTPIDNSIEKGGYYRMIAGTTPAAGNEITETCPTGARWDLIACNLTLTPISNTGRWIRFAINNNGRVPYISAMTAVSTADTENINFIVSQSPIFMTLHLNSFNTFLSPINTPTVLLAGDFFETLTVNLAPGDQYLQPTYLVREWLEVQ